MSHFYDEITTALPELQVLKDEPMSRHTTFRIGGPADYFVCPDREQIAEVLAVAKKCGMAITVIGNGSNLLVGVCCRNSWKRRWSCNHECRSIRRRDEGYLKNGDGSDAGGRAENT